MLSVRPLKLTPKSRALLAALGAGACANAQGAEVTVSSLAELAEYAKQDGNTVTLTPGEYHLTDLLTPKEIEAKRKRRESTLFEFSGSRNTFHFKGTTIRHDTAIRTTLRPRIHSDEFVVSGQENTLHDLKILCFGEGTSPGGALLAMEGKGNTLIGARLLSQGSFPYGYGDLLGKGGGALVSTRKHSGLLVEGDGTHLKDCMLVMRSFGHGIYLQKDASNVLIENCEVRSVTRATDKMLTERGTIVHEKGFRTTIRNRKGKNLILPGYTKSLAEDGFRTYGRHDNLVIRNCKAINMRGGFEIRTESPVLIENCVAIGCERGFWISDRTKLKNCSGDTRFGPLLYTEGEGSEAELTLLPDSSSSTVHAIAAIHGKNHKITIKSDNGRQRIPARPILLGYSSPSAGENMSPFGVNRATGITLTNLTTMPLIIGEKASDCTVQSKGPILENKGENITVQ